MLPAGHVVVHAPVQADVVRPDVAPYLPASQRLQVVAPASLHCPGLQAPLHDADTAACAVPILPALQLVHADAPPRENFPAGHMPPAGDADPDPALHA